MTMRGWYWLGMMVIALGVTLIEVLAAGNVSDDPRQHRLNHS
jgi:hypothetical protein